MIETCNDEQPAGLETRNIFLDTEVFRSYGHNLNAKTMKILGGYVADGIFVLHTTDVTLREVSRQIGAMERELTNHPNKVAKELTRWNDRYRFDLHRLPVPDPLSEPADPSRAYHDFEWTVRREWNAREHCAADLSMSPVLDQYFNRQAPFDIEGSKEFPDAIALLALETWCARTQERTYVVSKDKAVRRAADESDHLIAVDSLDRLLAKVASADGHDMSATVSAALDDPPLLDELQDTLTAAIGQVGGLYDGDRHDGEVLAIEIVELEEIENVTVLRVEHDQVACVADVRLRVSAEIDYTDLSEAMWDSEDKRYYGGKSVVAEIEETVSAKILVELARDGQDFTLSSAQFVTQDLTVSDFVDDGYPYK